MKKLALILLASLLMAACKKGNVEPQDQANDPDPVPAVKNYILVMTNVYIGDTVKFYVNNSHLVPKQPYHNPNAVLTAKTSFTIDAVNIKTGDSIVIKYSPGPMVTYPETGHISLGGKALYNNPGDFPIGRRKQTWRYLVK